MLKHKYSIRDYQGTEGIQHMNLEISEENKDIKYKNT